MYVEVPWTDTQYQLPIASSQTLGGVKIGEGVNIDNNGAISVGTPKIAIDTSNLLESGNISYTEPGTVINNTGWVVIYGEFRDYSLMVDDVEVIQMYSYNQIRDTYMMICTSGTALKCNLLDGTSRTYKVYGLK